MKKQTMTVTSEMENKIHSNTDKKSNIFFKIKNLLYKSPSKT